MTDAAAGSTATNFSMLLRMSCAPQEGRSPQLPPASNLHPQIFFLASAALAIARQGQPPAFFTAPTDRQATMFEQPDSDRLQGGGPDPLRTRRTAARWRIPPYRRSAPRGFLPITSYTRVPFLPTAQQALSLPPRVAAVFNSRLALFEARFPAFPIQSSSYRRCAHRAHLLDTYFGRQSVGRRCFEGQISAVTGANHPSVESGLWTFVASPSV